MFERTLEAQTLGASARSLSPFSVALGIHLAVALAMVGVSLVMVPEVVTPEIIAIEFIPDPQIPDPGPSRPAQAVPPQPKKGVEDPGRSVTASTVELQPLEPPTATPAELPPAPPAEIGEGFGEGPKGVPNGSETGIAGGTGSGSAGSGEGREGDGGPREITGDMQAPVLLRRVAPAYPNAARLGRIQGRVTVEAVVGLDGRVESVEILRSSNPLFEDAARDAVRQWRYRPASMNGGPVRVYFTVEVEFVLR